MPPILQQLQDYFKTRFTLLKYETIDKATAIIADMIVDLVIGFFLLMGFIFLTIALGFFLADILKSYWAGFGIVTVIYVVIIFFGHLLKTPVQNVLVRVFITKTFKNRD